MEDYDTQVATGKLIVEKTSVIQDGKQVSAVKTTTIRDPLVQTMSVTDLQTRLDDLQQQRIDATNNSNAINIMIDYYTKALAATKKG